MRAVKLSTRLGDDNIVHCVVFILYSIFYCPGLI